MKTKVLKCIANAICAILYIATMAWSGVAGATSCMIVMLTNSQVNKTGFILTSIIGIFVSTIMLAYMTMKERPWMPFEPIDNYSVWPKN